MSDQFNPYAELMVNPKGPGDARPTANQILRDSDVIGKWKGKVALVTGATSGLGIETARALHRTGADVYITARDTRKAKGVIDDILKSSEGGGKLEVVEMDMNSLDSAKQAAKDFLAKSDKLNILVTNAGIMATPEGTKTTDGYEAQFGVNHLAHFTLTALLLPSLVKSSTPTFNSRVVTLTSNAHRYSSIHWDDTNITKDYDPWVSYGQSKTANIWMANYIDRVYGPKGVHANSVHPGGIMTNLVQNLKPEQVEAWGKDKAFMATFLNEEQGAATTVWAAVSGVWEGKGGKYLNAVGVTGPAKELMNIADSGYAPWAFDPVGEDRLWELSEKITGVKVEE